MPLWYGNNDNNIKLGFDGNKKQFYINFHHIQAVWLI